MISRRWQALRQRRDRSSLVRRAIPDALWQRTLDALPFLAPRSPSDLERLRRLASLFLDRKEFSGGGGFVIDDAIAVAVATQACLPVLDSASISYDGFVGIVMHADAVVARREITDDDGIVHDYDEVLAGEAMEGGPVMLCWPDVQGGDTDSARPAPTTS